MKLQDLFEMKMPQYSYEEAIEHATKEARRRNDDMLVLQRVDDPDAEDAYEVYAEDAYIRWSMSGREAFEIIARVDSKGNVSEH